MPNVTEIRIAVKRTEIKRIEIVLRVADRQRGVLAHIDSRRKKDVVDIAVSRAEHRSCRINQCHQVVRSQWPRQRIIDDPTLPYRISVARMRSHEFISHMHEAAVSPVR